MNWPNVNPTLSGPPRAFADGLGVYDQIALSCKRDAPNPAIVHGARTTTYAELISRIHEVRNQFVSLGIPPDSAIVIQLPRGTRVRCRRTRGLSSWFPFHTGCGD